MKLVSRDSSSKILGQGVTLGISDDKRFFTLNGVPTFLYGVSYYGAQSIATASFRTMDLDDMVSDGFNWIRVWAYWGYGGDNVSVTEFNGTIRNPYMERFKTLIAECNTRGIVVDVTMRRSEHPFPSTLDEHLACAKVLAKELKEFRNIYIDVANERNVKGARYVSLQEVQKIIQAIKAIDPDRICTASGTRYTHQDLHDHFFTGRCDFIAPHLGRKQGSAAETVATVKEYIEWMEQDNCRAPIHLQEPFRRGYTDYNPAADDFFRDCTGAKVAEAAGWCFHNGSNKFASDERPFRSFLMSNSEGRLYSQWDSVEQEVRRTLKDRIGDMRANTRCYQAQYSEQLNHQIGRTEGTSWSANVAQDAAGFLSYGPYLNTIPAGNHRVTWRLMINNNGGDNNAVATIDIHANGNILAEKSIKRQDFVSLNTWQEFSVEFTSTGQKNVEFRTYWHKQANIKVDWVALDIHSGPPQNQAPRVSAGPDQSITLPNFKVTLQGTVVDDGLPNPPGKVTVEWTTLSGPGPVTFSDAHTVKPVAKFSETGTYLLRLTADDSELTSYDEVAIKVNPAGCQELIKAYQGETDFHHQSGAPIAGGWRVTTSHPHTYPAFGPYDTALPAGDMIARLYLRVENITVDDGYVCILDIHDLTAGKVLAKGLLSRKDWTQAGVYQTFDLPFPNIAGHNMEFRIYYMGFGQLDLDKVEIWSGPGNPD